MKHDSLEEFLARLDEWDAPAQWELEYARHRVEMDRDDAARVFELGRPYSRWFGLRFDASPPGMPLPPLADALQRVLTTRDGTPLDAYQAVFHDAVVRMDLPPEGIVALLVNSTLSVLRSGTSYLGLWLAGRAGVAAVALGFPQSAWNLLGLLTPANKQHPELRLLGQLALLRGQDGLENHAVVKVALADLWPELGVPAVPTLAVSALSDDDWRSFPATVEHLTQVGAVDVAKLALRFYARVRIPREQADAFMASLRQVVARLDDGRTLSQQEVMTAINAIEVPKLSAPFLELVSREIEWRRPLEAVFHPLLLARAAWGTEFEEPYGVGMAKYAAERIMEHRLTGLFDLAMELLDRLVARGGAWPPLSDLHFQRARLRCARGGLGDDDILHCIADFEVASRMAQERGDDELVALATSSAVKAGALAIYQKRSLPGVTFERMRRLLETAQASVSAPRHRALLYQAEGHLARTIGPEHSIAPFEQAIILLPQNNPSWVEISAELVDSLIRSGFHRRAAARGVALLDAVSASAGETELAMLRTSTATALVASGRANDALAQLERALDLVRGRDPQTELNVRLHLVRTSLVAQRRPLVEEHLRVLHDRAEELDPTMRADLEGFAEFAERFPEHEDQPATLRRVGLPATLDVPEHDDLDDAKMGPGSRALQAARVYVSGVVGSDPAARLALMSVTLGAIGDAVDDAGATGDTAALIEAALLVGELVLDELEPRAELAERFWSLIVEAAAGWLTSTDLRERVVQVTRSLATRILADQGQEDQDRELRSAEDAVVWLARAHEVTRAPLLARVVQPQRASAGMWDRWLAALQANDSARVQAELTTIRERDPTYLTVTGDPSATWQWLEGRPGSVAVHPLRADGQTFVVAMRVCNGERSSIAVEVDDHRVSRALKGAGADHRAEAEALRSALLSPLLAALGEEPTVVLWIPTPELREVPPALLWPHIPIATGVGLPTVHGRTMPRRRRSTLVALADPGPGSERDLRGRGEAALKALAEAARARGPVRTLGSVGGAYGRALLGNTPDVRDTPASASDLLAEVKDHDILVIMAHGDAATLEDAALLTVAMDGEEERLEIDRLGRPPDRFAGVGVVLLSCRAGRVGEALADPGGIAGALISAGARWVVAPLIEVGVDLAKEVGVEVLDGLAAGLEPWESLRPSNAPRVAHGSDSPELGGRPTGPSRRLQRDSFVTWVG